MRIEDLWLRQVKQQGNWYEVAALTEDERAELTKELLLGLHEEVGELARRVDQSRYHILRHSEKQDPGAIAYDGVDVFKYLVSILSLHGVTPEQFASEFFRKTDVVDDRWRGENLALENEQVLLCDLDGCVADWVDAFKTFALARGVEIPPNGYNNPELEPLKDEFDRSGGYLDIKPIEGAVEALNELRKRMKIVVVTARPHQRFRRVHADTLSWCNKVGIKYDHILFLRDKAEAVRRVAPAKIVAMIEDRAKHAIEVALTGVKVLKMPCETIESASHSNIIEVNGWYEIMLNINKLTGV